GPKPAEVCPARLAKPRGAGAPALLVSLRLQRQSVCFEISGKLRWVNGNGGRQTGGLRVAGQTEQVLNAILMDIEAGRLTPGAGLDEADLVSRHGVSRTPVREAFIQLEAIGLIKRLPRKGAVLFKPTLEEFLAILEVHARLEGQAAGLAARRMTQDQARALAQIVCACETHAAEKGDGDPAGYYQLNLQFHGAVAQGAGNAFLLEMIKTNARKLMAYYRARYRFPGSIAQSAKEHREIAELIFAHDREAAEAAMVRHVQFDQVTVMDLLAALG
ncbi:transcriptional regulator, GntR family protein, partial [Roseobacter sp. SK209-2-6]